MSFLSNPKGWIGYRPLWLIRVLPFLAWSGSVTRTTLRADLAAALTGAVVVLPQGVAFAFIAGLPPEYGLYSAIVIPVVAALFGSSRHLVSGPTTAISLVVFAAVSRHAEPGTAAFVELALTLTFLAGLYQFGLGLARLGVLVNFVSHTVVVGFTAGAAILIATSQMPHVLGIRLPRGESFLHTWMDLGLHFPDSNLLAASLALLTLATALWLRRRCPRQPFMLCALALASVVALLVGQGHELAFVGEVPRQLPSPSLPLFSFAALRELSTEAFAVALLGLIEAVSIGRSIAAKSGQRIDGNQEFIGQGLSNLVGSFFSSYAGSGSFTRSGVNYAAGAQTPLAAVFAAGILALILLTLGPLIAYLPIPAMAGVILLVAYNLLDFHELRRIFRSGGEEIAIFVVTFSATLFLSLEFAIYAGVLLSLSFYLKRTARPLVIPVAPDPRERKRRLTSLNRRPLPQCPQLKIVRIDGSLFFGAVNHVAERLQQLRESHPEASHLLLLADGINFVDLTGAEWLAAESRRWQLRGGGLFLCGLKRAPRETLVRSEALREIGPSHLFAHKNDALRELVGRLSAERCARCTTRIFLDCPPAPARPAPEPAAADAPGAPPALPAA